MTDVKKRLVQMQEGVLVEEDVLKIVDKIRAYDDNLRVRYIDPKLAEWRDAPYAIFEVCPDGNERLVFSVWELDERILERLYAADKTRFNMEEQLNHANALAQKRHYERYQEKRMEEKDIVTSFLKSPKGQWSFKNQKGQLVELDDDPARKSKVDGKPI